LSFRSQSASWRHLRQFDAFLDQEAQAEKPSRFASLYAPQFRESPFTGFFHGFRDRSVFHQFRRSVIEPKNWSRFRPRIPTVEAAAYGAVKKEPGVIPLLASPQGGKIRAPKSSDIFTAPCPPQRGTKKAQTEMKFCDFCAFLWPFLSRFRISD